MRSIRSKPNFISGIACAAAVIVLTGLCGRTVAQTTKPNYYPATSDGLTLYFQHMLLATENNDQRHLLAMCQALVLPKPKEWFSEVFGKEKGPKLTETYEKDMKNFGPSLAALFLRLNDPKSLKIEVIRIETPEDPQAKLVEPVAWEPLPDVLLRAPAVHAEPVILVTAPVAEIGIGERLVPPHHRDELPAVPDAGIRPPGHRNEPVPGFLDPLGHRLSDMPGPLPARHAEHSASRQCGAPRRIRYAGVGLSAG